MLEEYFVKPSTVDRIRGSWMAAEIENYVVWLVEHRYSVKSIWRRVPIVFAFGEFAGARGTSAISELPAHLEDAWAPGDPLRALNACWCRASARRLLRTYRARTTFFLPEARVMGLVPA